MVSVTMSGLRNHRDATVVDFFRWLGSRASRSYGLLYIRDDEDSRRGKDYENKFRVWRLARGRLDELDDSFLSPYVPKVEENLDDSG